MSTTFPNRRMRFLQANRVVHRWGSILTALPLLVILVSGGVLLFKKDVAWIQPPSRKGAAEQPAISFARVLDISKTIPEAKIHGWEDIDRLDVRPDKGVIKVRANNRWEIQIDAATGDVLQVAFRRSDLIEDVHVGSFFHPSFKFWVVLPSAVILFLIWLSGIYLFFFPYLARRKAGTPPIEERY